jgi:hypothetical protein
VCLEIVERGLVCVIDCNVYTCRLHQRELHDSVPG